jgi:hypothetical protein
VRVRVNGAWHEAVAPAVEVTGVEQQDFVHVTITGSGREMLVDEPFTVTLEVRIRGLEGEYAANEPLFAQSPPALEAEYLNFVHPKGLDGPDVNAALGSIVANGNVQGFTINNIRDNGFASFFGGGSALRFRPQHRTEQVGNVLWHVYTLATTYIAREEGEYQFGPVTFKGPVIAGVEVVNGRAQGVPREIFAVGSALVVRVAPPPEEGRPNTFFGGVGKAMRARTELDTAICKMGDPLTLTLDITGEVSLRNLRPLRLSEQVDVTMFRIYDESVKSSAIEGGRRFTYSVRPLVSGTIEFPALELSYYDVAKRRYETVRTLPIPLQVQATTQIFVEFADDGGLHADANDRFPSGITLSRHAQPAAWQRVEFWLMLALGPLLFAFSVASGWVLPQTRKAWKAFRSWQGARTCHGALRSASDAAQLERAFRRFLAARVKLAGESITPPEAEAALRGRDEIAARETRACLEQLAEAVYRREGGGDFAALKESVLACVAKLEEMS